MPADIRLCTTFFAHPKTKRLAKRLGEDAVLSLLRLWCWAADNKPRGVLDGMDSEAIELAADYDGAEGALYAELVALRFIDVVDGVAVIHDWSEHNPWVYAAPERSEAARAAANKRWKPGKTDADSMRSACAPHTQGMHSACDPHTLGNAERMRPLQKGNAPLLSSPNLTYPNLTNSHVNAHMGAREHQGRWDGQVNQAVAERWDAFREAYPWRNRIEEASQVWVDTLRDGAEADMAIAALEEQKARRKELQDAGHWVPQWRSAKNWIAGRGWEDEPLQPDLTRRTAARDNGKRSQLDRNRDALAAWATDD